MVTSVLDVYNAAISAMRGKGRLSSLSDVSREREECDVWYPIVRDQAQAAARWNCCRATVRLSTEVFVRDTSVDWTEAAPDPEYLYAYALPTNYLRAWHIANFDRFSITYNVNQSKPLLHTSRENPVLVYARANSDPSQWSPGLASAIIHALAAQIAGPLTGNTTVVQLNLQLANNAILEARAADANSSPERLETIPPQFQARGYSSGQLPARYFYPLGKLFEAPLTDA